MGDRSSNGESPSMISVFRRVNNPVDSGWEILMLPDPLKYAENVPKGRLATGSVTNTDFAAQVFPCPTSFFVPGKTKVRKTEEVFRPL